MKTLSTRTYEQLEAQYPDFDALDEAFPLERTKNGDFVDLDYECGQNSDAICEADRQRRLITVVSGDNGEWLYCVGYCRVNRMNYYRTVSPMPVDLYESRLAVE